jgi:putative Ca2+/H+ antiporter (TMEM165/GDT1 family)
VSFEVAAAAAFPIVFLGELPDKTMFASLVMASRGRPLSVWVGAAAAFALHVCIAVSVGAALFTILPHRAVMAVVAGLFFAGAIYSFAIRNRSDEGAHVGELDTPFRTAVTAAAVIFAAEWGDLTQLLTANLAARYHSPVGVGVGSLAALLSVAAISVVAGSGLLRVLSVRILRVVTAVVLVGLGAYELAGVV